MKKLIIAVGVLIIITAFEEGARVKLASRIQSNEPNTVQVVNKVDSLVSKLELLNKSNHHGK